MNYTSVQRTDCFSDADILLPEGIDLQRWAVIACDQFTSQPSYWEEVHKLTDSQPSAGKLILPECDLEGNVDQKIQDIHCNMKRYLDEQILRRYPDSFIYTERVMLDGQIRSGLIGKIDLEQYDYSGKEDASIRATEKTVTERIPPRMAVRRGALLELPHVLLLCDDEQCCVIESLSDVKDQLAKLYDFDLMLGGGHICGWLVSGHEKEELKRRIKEYEIRERKKHPDKALLYAVGDGNHSLATAKACFEELKRMEGETALQNHPARYALCELNNIHDPSQVFEPIHRIVKHCSPENLIQDLMRALDTENGFPIPWFSGELQGVLHLPKQGAMLPLAVLQNYLDNWLSDNSGQIDYIHGEEALKQLAMGSDTVGFLLPPIDKNDLFPGILSGGVLPRKTFSLGEPEEKRYYLEARRILP